MKLFFLILLTLASVNMSARENGEVVISAKTGISNSHQKTNIPKAYYSDDDGVLEIEFESDQEFYLEVSDENGNLVYCSTINTDGNANFQIKFRSKTQLHHYNHIFQRNLYWRN